MRLILMVCGVSMLAVFWTSCADTATCSSDEVLVDGLCHPVLPPATGGAPTTASGGMGGSAGEAAQESVAAGAGGAP
jgi:hypothetical protein